MAKIVDDSVLDAALNTIKNATGLTAIVCSAQPTTRTEAVTTYALADIALAASDVVVANGDTSGRKATVAAKAAVPIDTSGTANHLALVSSTLLLYVTTTATQALSSGGGATVDIGSWKIEIGDPT